MNPDVTAAIERLERQGVLTPEQSSTFGRVARGELVSVRAELRLVLYGGVLALTSGVALLVRENLERIGPVTIAGALWVAAVGALVWALRHAPPFSWGKSASSHLAADYMLLLGVLLTGAAMAYVEVQFTPLGEAWSYHLLVLSLVGAVLAVRCDSAIVAGMALTIFAAWRGVAVASLRHAFWSRDAGVDWLRVNAVLVGLLFVALGYGCGRFARKAHFEPTATHLGWLLVLGGIASGITLSGATGAFFSLGLVAVGGGLALVSFPYARFALFGMGVVAAYAGLSAGVLRLVSEPFIVFSWFVATGAAVLVGLLVSHKTIGARE